MVSLLPRILSAGASAYCSGAHCRRCPGLRFSDGQVAAVQHQLGCAWSSHSSVYVALPDTASSRSRSQGRARGPWS
jgi:hypothetical protein